MVYPGQLHGSSPHELMERIDAERRGSPFLMYRDEAGQQCLVDLDAAPDRLFIGRNPDNKVAIPWDPEASRLHAELERIAGEWTAADGHSRNGTWVNEQRISGRTILADGDVLRVGRTHLTFHSIDAEQGATTV